MEILTGKVINKNESEPAGQVKEVELFTNPVAVHRIRLSFGAVPVVQLFLSLICGGVLWYFRNNGGEMQSAAEEIVRRIIGG